MVSRQESRPAIRNEINNDNNKSNGSKEDFNGDDGRGGKPRRFPALYVTWSGWD